MIETLKKKAYKEVAEELEKSLEEFKQKVSGISDVDELTKLEDDLMEDQKKFDEYIKAVKYTLPDSTEYDGERFTKNDIANSLLNF